MNISKKFSLRNFREQMAFYGINLCNAEEERVYLETVSDLEERALEALNNIGEIKQRLNQFKQHFNDFISEIKKRKLYLNKMLIDDQQKDNIMATRKINYFSKKLEELLFQDKLSEQMVINNVLVNSFEEELQDFYDIYRYLLSFLASTSTRLEWQSVSFESSKRPEIFLKEEFDYKEASLIRLKDMFAGYRYYIYLSNVNYLFRVIYPEWTYFTAYYLLNKKIENLIQHQGNSLKIHSAIRVPAIILRNLYSHSQQLKIGGVLEFEGVTDVGIAETLNYLNEGKHE